MSRNPEQIKKERLEALPMFDTLDEAIAFARKEREETAQIYGFFTKEADGVEKYTVSILRDWELLSRNGFKKIKDFPY